MLVVLEMVAIVLGIVMVVAFTIGTILAYNAYRRSQTTMERVNAILGSMEQAMKTRESILGHAQQIGRAISEIVDLIQQVRHAMKHARGQVKEE